MNDLMERFETVAVEMAQQLQGVCDALEDEGVDIGAVKMLLSDFDKVMSEIGVRNKDLVTIQISGALFDAEAFRDGIVKAVKDGSG